MNILFSPSQTKRQGGQSDASWSLEKLFLSQYAHRDPIVERYNALFGAWDTSMLMPAVLRYDGVAYDYLNYEGLPIDAQNYLDTHLVIFSDLLGSVLGGDLIGLYRLKQGGKLAEIAIDKHYRTHTQTALDAYLANAPLLDLRAGIYDKFFAPTIAHTTVRFLKEGKIISHWAKAYRGVLARHVALHKPKTLEALALELPSSMQLIDVTHKALQTQWTIALGAST